MGHFAKDCPEEKKSKDSSGGSSGGFTMMCVEVSDLPVEGESQQTTAHHTKQLNSDVNSEVTKNPEAQLEQNVCHSKTGLTVRRSHP